MEVDITGAGDHLDKVDAKIRRIKETVRSVTAGLPWKVPDDRVKDLVTYCVSRINTRRTTASNDNSAPRVRFTGIKVNYHKEYSLGFGEYCECYNPKVISNNSEQPRTEPCIALYPAANATGSWIFLNLNTNKYVRRSSWVKMSTTDLVVRRMNELAKTDAAAGGQEYPLATDEDFAGGADEVEVQEGMISAAPTPAMHIPKINPLYPTIITAAEEEAEENMEMQDVENEEEEGETYEERSEAPAERPVHEERGNIPQAVLGDRRSARIAEGIKRPARYDSDVVEYSLHTSMKAGLKEHGQAAYEAVIKEFTQLFRNKKALVPVKKGELTWQQRRQVIRSSMFMKSKYDARGVFEKIKARLVADGSMQDRSLYPNNSSPTVSMRSLFTCLGIAAREGRQVMKIDITGAYLNAEMEGEEMLMRLDETTTSVLKSGLPEVIPFIEGGTLIVRLDKALYGCVQSAKLWFDKLTGVLKDLGFTANPVDACVMNKEIQGKQITLTIYVDDILAMSERVEDLEWLVGELNSTFDEVTSELSNDFSYLGMHIIMADGTANISMKTFVNELVDFYGKTQLKTKATPATDDLFERKESRALNAGERNFFHTMAAKLLYLSKRTRCDIALPVSYVCTRVSNATEEDVEKMDRIMGYLKLTGERVMKIHCRDDSNGVTAYIDAAFGCHHDGKSHSGAVIQWGGATVLTVSRKQKIVTKDSTEAELVALSDLVTEVERSHEFVCEQGVIGVETPVIFQDNTSTISMVEEGGGKPRTKHMRVRQNLVKERIDSGELKVIYVPSRRMLADVLTKPLHGVLFGEMTGKIMGEI
jgi:hypothetical protein